MTGSALFLGVDGGGTKTEYLCIDARRGEVARSVGGTTYHLEVGLDVAVDRLRGGVDDICRQAGIAPDALCFAFFGLPAFGEDGVADPQLEAACRAILGHDRFRCGNDMICGWAGSLGCEDGINLVAGTGSIAYGERAGLGARAGGWGEIFGDEGSAYWIAIRGLDGFARMSDGRLPKGHMHTIISQHLDLSHDLALCERIMGPQALGRSAIAALAPLVSAAADAGDAAALGILQTAGGELAALAVALRRTLGYADDEVTRLSWSGSVLRHSAAVREAFVSALDQAGGFALVDPLHTPGQGAALYAAHLSGLQLSPGPASAPFLRSRV